MGFPSDSVCKESTFIAIDSGDVGSIPELGRSPEEGNGNPLQYSCLENPMDRGAYWEATLPIPAGCPRAPHGSRLTSVASSAKGYRAQGPIPNNSAFPSHSLGLKQQKASILP